MEIDDNVVAISRDSGSVIDDDDTTDTTCHQRLDIRHLPSMMDSSVTVHGAVREELKSDLNMKVHVSGQMLI